MDIDKSFHFWQKTTPFTMQLQAFWRIDYNELCCTVIWPGDVTFVSTVRSSVVAIVVSPFLLPVPLIEETDKGALDYHSIDWSNL